MAAPTVTTEDAVYTATTADPAITLTDDAFSIVNVIQELTLAIKELSRRLG